MRLLRLTTLQCATITPPRSWPLGLAAVLSLGLAGCGGSSTEVDQAAPEQAGATAVAGRSEVALAVADTTATATWTFLANEYEAFSVSDTRIVRYGTGSSWVERSVTGRATRTNEFLGSDPAMIQVKRCEVQGTNAPAPAPAPASVLAAAPATVGTATRGWAAATDSRVAGYRVYWGTAPGTYRQTRSVGLAAGTATSYTVRDLPAGSTYYFAVTAYDGAGNESAFSAEASKTIP